MRWKWSEGSDGSHGTDGPQDRAGRDRIRSELERRGVAPELCERLSSRVQSQLQAVDPRGHGALLDGVAVGSGVREEATQKLGRHLRDLNEIERLMGAFATELSKLDEVLEVLAAHVRRMRSSAPAPHDRQLH